MSLFWIFVIVFANAWVLGLWLLPRLQRQSSGVANLFVGAVVGAANFAVGGAVHVRTMVENPTMSMAVAFGLRFLLHTMLMFGFYERPHGGRAAKPEPAKQWGSAALGGLYFSAVALLLEMYVLAQPGWEASDLYFTVQNVRDAFM